MRDDQTPPRRMRLSWWTGAILFAAIAVFLLWEEHSAHLLGALPWVILAACPLIHVFMHRGHGHGGHTHGGHSLEDHSAELTGFGRSRDGGDTDGANDPPTSAHEPPRSDHGDYR